MRFQAGDELRMLDFDSGKQTGLLKTSSGSAIRLAWDDR